MIKIITAEEFMSKATRIINIPGFADDEIFSVKIKNVSVVSMLTNGKLPNSLLQVVKDLFSEQGTSIEDLGEEEAIELLKDTEKIKELTRMMKEVAREALIEPKYEDIAEGLTDAQIQSIYNQASGAGVKKITPSNGK